MGAAVEQRRLTDTELKRKWSLDVFRGQGKLWKDVGTNQVELDTVTMQNAFDAFGFVNIPVASMTFSAERLAKLRNIDEMHQFLGEASVLLRAQAEKNNTQI